MSTKGSTYRTAIITAIRQETAGVKTFIVTYEDGSDIAYVAGQFITIIFTSRGVEERRSYSISSASVCGEPLSFTVKRIDNGAYSRLLYDDTVVGDRLTFSGVAGLFVLPENKQLYLQYFFFAAGIGITPIFSLIKTLLHTTTSAKVVLVFSNRWQESVVFYDALHELTGKFGDRLQIEYLYSTSYHLERARLTKGLMPELMKQYAQAPKNYMLFYVCGPYNYMRMVNLALEEQGIHSEQMRKENFRPFERPVIKADPPDHRTRMVTIVQKGQSNTFPCHYPESILHAAQRNGVTLPYSCEVGRCGSCAGHCTSGKVWMSYDEVLMDADERKGIVLTCTGHPNGGDVVIEL